MFNLQEFLTTHQPKNGRFFTVAIDGRGGCGKSTLAELLKLKLPGFVVLNGDDYFEPIKNQVAWGEFNDRRFIKDVIDPLKRKNMFLYRPYDWHAQPPITEKQIEVIEGFCLERCYSFTFDLDWDLKIWVETPREICLERGIAREHMPHDRVIGAWKQWQAAEDAYIQNFRPQEKADVILDGMKPFEEQL